MWKPKLPIDIPYLGNNGKQGPFELRENDFMFVSDKKETKVNAMETDYIFKITRNGYKHHIDFYPQMMMTFDGNYINMLAWPQIRGTNCGMCGDYNRNTFYELKDPMVVVEMLWKYEFNNVSR